MTIIMAKVIGGFDKLIYIKSLEQYQAYNKTIEMLAAIIIITMYSLGAMWLSSFESSLYARLPGSEFQYHQLFAVCHWAFSSFLKPLFSFSGNRSANDTFLRGYLWRFKWDNIKHTAWSLTYCKKEKILQQNNKILKPKSWLYGINRRFYTAGEFLSWNMSLVHIQIRAQ